MSYVTNLNVGLNGSAVETASQAIQRANASVATAIAPVFPAIDASALPADIKVLIKTRPVEAILKIVQPAEDRLMRIISKANTMSGVRERRVGISGVNEVKVYMWLVQPGDALLDPTTRDLVRRMRIAICFMTLLTQAPGFLAVATAQVMVEDGLWTAAKAADILGPLAAQAGGSIAQAASVAKQVADDVAKKAQKAAQDAVKAAQSAGQAVQNAGQTAANVVKSLFGAVAEGSAAVAGGTGAVAAAEGGGVSATMLAILERTASLLLTPGVVIAFVGLLGTALTAAGQAAGAKAQAAGGPAANAAANVNAGQPAGQSSSGSPGTPGTSQGRVANQQSEPNMILPLLGVGAVLYFALK